MPTQDVGGNTDITGGYPHAANVEDTRQAAHTLSNDQPVDVNFNAVVSRSQALTVDLAGKGFQAAQERRQILADAAIGKP